MGHKRVDKEDEQLPTLACDYGFFGKAAYLVVKDRQSRAIWSHLVPAKGVDNPYGAKKLLADVQWSGYKRLNLKSDQEPAIRAVCEYVKANFHGEIIPEAPPTEGHEKSNGEAEQAVGMVAGMCRTLKESVEFHAHVKLDEQHPILAWIVEHAGNLITLYSRGEPKDGLTPYQRLKGKPWRIPLPPFGEAVEYKRRTSSKLEGRWREGIFLGVKLMTTEKIIGDAEGVWTVQSVKRKPEEDRWNGELINQVQGTPWLPNPKGGEPTELEDLVAMAPEMPDVKAQEADTFETDKVPKRFYITRANLEKHGYTLNCQACDAQRAGRSQAGIVHNSECRRRLEELIATDPKGRERLERSRDKQTEAVSEQIRKQEGEAEAKRARRSEGEGVTDRTDHHPQAAASESSQVGRDGSNRPPSKEDRYEEGTRQEAAAAAAPVGRDGSFRPPSENNENGEFCPRPEWDIPLPEPPAPKRRKGEEEVLELMLLEHRERAWKVSCQSKKTRHDPSVRNRRS